MPTTGPKPKGFVCPRCGTPLVVVKTRRSAKGIVSRRRRCPAKGCSYTVATEERPKGAISGPGH